MAARGRSAVASVLKLEVLLENQSGGALEVQRFSSGSGGVQCSLRAGHKVRQGCRLLKFSFPSRAAAAGTELRCESSDGGALLLWPAPDGLSAWLGPVEQEATSAGSERCPRAEGSGGRARWQAVCASEHSGLVVRLHLLPASDRAPEAASAAEPSEVAPAGQGPEDEARAKEAFARSHASSARLTEAYGRAEADADLGVPVDAQGLADLPKLLKLSLLKLSCMEAMRHMQETLSAAQQAEDREEAEALRRALVLWACSWHGALETGLGLKGMPQSAGLRPQMEEFQEAPIADYSAVVNQELAEVAKGIVAGSMSIQRRLARGQRHWQGNGTEGVRRVLLRDLFMLLLNAKDARYDARSRLVLNRIAGSLGLPPGVVAAWEQRVGHELFEALQHPQREERPGQQGGPGSWRRKLKIGAAAVGGGALLAVTGGLAAPALGVAAGVVGGGIGSLGGIGAVVGGAVATTGAAIAASGSVAMLLFGAGGASLTGWKLTKRWKDVSEFAFEPVGPPPGVILGPQDRGSRGLGSVAVSICVPGALPSADDAAALWAPCGCFAPLAFSDAYALRWETKMLEDLNRVFTDLVQGQVAQKAASWWLQGAVATASSAAVAGTLVWPIWVMSSLNNLDNTWIVAAERAKQAGELLAEVITERKTVGGRPVNLVGYSMGAKVVFAALQALHRRGEYHCVGDVVLLGAPINTPFTSKDAAVDLSSGKRRQWQRARAVTAGRLVNGYFAMDWVLGFMHRYMEWGVCVAGLCPVGLPGVENVDLAGLVRSHHEYPAKLHDILALIAV